MNKTFLAVCLAMVPLVSSAQAGGVSLNLDQESPLSKWGRWTYLEEGTANYGFKLSQNRNRMPLTANWRHGDWVFKLNKDMMSDRHDLFFGLRISEDQLQTTSLGCMSNRSKNGFGSALCGVQLDMNLK